MHTPTPKWTMTTLGTENAVVHTGYADVGGVYRGGDEDFLHPDDAALIVKAVNSYEAIKTALRISLSWCTCHGCGEREIDMPEGVELRECDQCLPIRKALAIAEGKE